MYLSYVGIRVRDLNRSLNFYTKLFGLKEVARGDNTRFGGGEYVLLRDAKSGIKLELNWYPPGSSYAVPYTPGEGLDHIAFRVNNVRDTVKSLVEKGVEIAEIAPLLAEPIPDPSRPGWFRVAYVKDPDGNWIELYQHADPIGPSIPERY